MMIGSPIFDVLTVLGLSNTQISGTQRHTARHDTTARTKVSAF